jgi:hypothetical protein
MSTAEKRLDVDHNRRVGRVIAKAWSDPAFKARLKSDPKTVLQEEGIEILPDVEIQVIENTSNVTYLTIPTAKAPAGLTEEQIESISENWTTLSGSSSCFTCSPCVSKE